MEVEGESVQGLGGGEGYLVLLKRLRPVHRSGCPQVPRRPERDTRPLSHPWRASESGAGGGEGRAGLCHPQLGSSQWGWPLGGSFVFGDQEAKSLESCVPGQVPTQSSQADAAARA